MSMSESRDVFPLRPPKYRSWLGFFVGMVTKNLDESRHLHIEQGYEKVLFQKLNRFFLPGLRPKLII